MICKEIKDGWEMVYVRYCGWFVNFTGEVGPFSTPLGSVQPA